MGNEITVKIECNIDDLTNILKSKGFVINKKFTLDDLYFIPNDLKIENMNCREILSNAVLLRNITEYEPLNKVIKMTFKNKVFDNNGNILKQSKVDCEIIDFESGNKFLNAIGYKSLMRIKEEDNVFKKGDFEIAVKDIENGEKLIEIEISEKYNTIDKLIQEINKIGIPIDKSNYFVKKAEIELSKILL